MSGMRQETITRKDSGLPWLGTIPAHWRVLKFLRCVTIAEGQVDPEDDKYSTCPLIAPNHIESGTGRLIGVESAVEQGAISGKYECRPGDVIYSKIRPALRKATIAPFACLCSADMYPLRVDGGCLIPEYLLLYVLSDAFSVWAMLESNRVAMPKINRESLLDLRMAVPPIEEQRAIVKYLAREISRLDALVSAKQRLLDILAEKRKAVIATAVTRGLDPEVKLRDSGVPWLGEVPAHWEISPLRYLVRFVSGGTPDKGNSEFWSNGTIPWVSPKDMKVESLDDSEDHITDAALEASAAQILPNESVLIVVRGMILAHTVPVAVTAGPVTINQDLKALVCGERLLPRFLREMLAGGSHWLLSMTDASAHGTKKLETEVLQRFDLPVPPLHEQQAIVDYIARETAKLDKVRAATERTIGLLKERRAALIAAAVTGRIDVGGERAVADTLGSQRGVA